MVTLLLGHLECRFYDLHHHGLKIHNFSLELKQSNTLPTASCWSVSTLMRSYVFFNPKWHKSWDCPNRKCWAITQTVQRCNQMIPILECEVDGPSFGDWLGMGLIGTIIFILIAACCCCGICCFLVKKFFN